MRRRHTNSHRQGEIQLFTLAGMGFVRYESPERSPECLAGSRVDRLSWFAIGTRGRLARIVDGHELEILQLNIVVCIKEGKVKDVEVNTVLNTNVQEIYFRYATTGVARVQVRWGCQGHHDIGEEVAER
jgi:hypothetical protein